MNIQLAYGKTGYSFNLPDSYDIDIIEPVRIDGLKDQRLEVKRALRNPFNCKPLNEIVTEKDNVAIVFSDITRATPYNIILPVLLEELNKIPGSNICLFCANGTHRKVTDNELISILGEKIFHSYEIVQNDANDPDLFECVGVTSSGNSINVNKRILGFKHKILTGFIEPHFFAGFSGGGKALVPGLASATTIKFNHSIANLSKANVAWGITEGNPLWEDIMEASEMVPGIFLLNVALNKAKEITGVFAGDIRTAHHFGCQFVKRTSMTPVKRLYDIVITSNSGYPLDLNIYQTVKGMSAAAQVVKEGGHIIIAAECWDGIPAGSDYERILSSVNNVRELSDFIIENETRLKDTWQIFYQAAVQKKAEVYMYSDKIDDKTILTALLIPVKDIPGLVAGLSSKIGPRPGICILPEGPQTIAYLAENG